MSTAADRWTLDTSASCPPPAEATMDDVHAWIRDGGPAFTDLGDGRLPIGPAIDALTRAAAVGHMRPRHARSRTIRVEFGLRDGSRRVATLADCGPLPAPARR